MHPEISNILTAGFSDKTVLWLKELLFSLACHLSGPLKAWRSVVNTPGEAGAAFMGFGMILLIKDD